MDLFKKVLCFLLALPAVIFSQNQARFWYFGTNAGLDFSTNPPGILTNGMLNTTEGCASLSDAAGNLLFYTDGITIYNKTHAVMANGTGLTGNPSSTQSAIIVKAPGSQDIYYVFTLGASGNASLCVSTVDMSLASGNGSVTVKNMLLSTGMGEKLNSVKHCNGTDVWVLSHEYNSDKFKCYLVSSGGVNTTAVVSSIGSIHTSPNITWVGNLKVSPNGKKICAAMSGTGGTFELFDFDNVTGVISNSLNLGTYPYAYGCEFSPDGSKLYGSRELGTNYLSLYQWDLCAGSPSAIAASQFTLSVPSVIMGMQLATDGKIYIARYGQSTLAVIANPNASGAACNYIHNGQSIAPKVCQLNLPNFVTSFFSQTLSPATYTINCNTVSFTSPGMSSLPNAGCSAVQTATSSLWAFGDPASGAANSSTLTNPSHAFSAAGTYTVKLISYNPCSNDTVLMPITISNVAPTLSLAGTFSICGGEKRTFTVSGAGSYTWSGGANSSTVALSPTVTTAYTVSAGSGNCSASKLFTVTVLKCTGLSEAGETLPFRFYPNPASEVLNIESTEACTIRISDQLGETVLEQTVESGHHQVDIRHLKSGIYFVQYSNSRIKQQTRLVKIE